MSGRAKFTSTKIYLVITPKNVKIENSWQKLLPVQKCFQESACPEDRLDRSWLGPWVWYILVSDHHSLDSGQTRKPPGTIIQSITLSWLHSVITNMQVMIQVITIIVYALVQSVILGRIPKLYWHLVFTTQFNHQMDTYALSIIQ